MTYLTQNLVAPTVFENNAMPPRIEHLVNTEKGSSGGLCLDLASNAPNAVALHQAGYVLRMGSIARGSLQKRQCGMWPYRLHSSPQWPARWSRIVSQTRRAF